MLAPAPITALPMPAAAAADAPPASENGALAATIRAACDRLIALEDALNRLDARAGDGDTGSTAAAGARSVVAALPRLPLADPAATCRRIGDLLATSMGGSSGVLLSIFFTAAGQKLAGRAPASPTRCTTGSTASASTAAPRPGDRTLIDALAPAIAALRARRPRRRRRAPPSGAPPPPPTCATARAGRAAYLGGSDLTGAPDAGAEAVAAVFRARRRTTR